jgi:signal transduction histidine kinase
MVEEYDELVTDMKDGCVHLVEVVRGLRPLVRHDAPAGQGRADADKAVRYAVSVARHRARELLGDGNVEVQLDAPTKLPLVATAFPALVQVLTNLLNNAVEAIERNGEKGIVLLRADVDDEHVRVEIEDNGGGIPRAILGKVTDPFFTTRAAGTGLGLAQVRRLVETAGGTFEIASEEGDGTKVSFTFARV